MTVYRHAIGPSLGLITIVLFGACTSGVSTTEPTTTTSPSTSQTTSSATDTTTSSQTATSVPASSTETLAGVEVSTSAYEWAFSRVDVGTKPALAIEANGTPHIQYMLESQNGWVREARWDGSQWVVSTVAEGYFYGPGDIAIGPDDVPRISYHDHQDTGFDPAKGDAVYAYEQDGTWVVEAIQTPGHDGWDNRLFVDAEGVPHISAVDPKDFSGVGVKYYHLNGAEWQVERVGQTPISYAWGTSLAVDSTGRPHIVFHNDTSKDLRYATRSPEGGDWDVTAVDTGNRAGLFPDIALDTEGNPHISYIQMEGDTGFLKYAVLQDGAWAITKIDQLDSVFLSTSLGDKGARNLTSIVLDGQGNPIISYSDEAVMKIARFNGTEWTTETVATADGDPLAQITSLRIDGDGNLHLSYATITGTRPLAGEVWYAKGTAANNR